MSFLGVCGTRERQTGNHKEIDRKIKYKRMSIDNKLVGYNYDRFGTKEREAVNHEGRHTNILYKRVSIDRYTDRV